MVFIKRKAKITKFGRITCEKLLSRREDSDILKTIVETRLMTVPMDFEIALVAENTCLLPNVILLKQTHHVVCQQNVILIIDKKLKKPVKKSNSK